MPLRLRAERAARLAGSMVEVAMCTKVWRRCAVSMMITKDDHGTYIVFLGEEDATASGLVSKELRHERDGRSLMYLIGQENKIGRSMSAVGGKLKLLCNVHPRHSEHHGCVPSKYLRN